MLSAAYVRFSVAADRRMFGVQKIDPEAFVVDRVPQTGTQAKAGPIGHPSVRDVACDALIDPLHRRSTFSVGSFTAFYRAGKLRSDKICGHRRWQNA